MNKKTTRLSSIALALMMVLMVALTLVPVGVAGAASGSGGVEIELGSTSSKLDANYAISWEEGQEGIRLVAKSVLWNDSKTYSNVTMQLIDPNEASINIPGTSSKKVNMTAYPGRAGDYYYDFDIDDQDADLDTGLYSVIFQRTDSGWMDEGFEVGAFWLYKAAGTYSLLTSAATDHKFAENVTSPPVNIKESTSGTDESYAKPEAKFSLTAKLDTGVTGATVKYFGYKGFLGQKKSQAAGDVKYDYTLSASATHLDEFENVAIALDTGGGNDRALKKCEGTLLYPSSAAAQDVATVIVDAKGPVIGELAISNSAFIGKKYPNIMFATDPNPTSTTHVEASSLVDDDSGLVTDNGYVRYTNLYNKNQVIGSITDTPLDATVDDNDYYYGITKYPKAAAREIDFANPKEDVLVNGYWKIEVVSVDEVGNESVKEVGNVRVHDQYIEIESTRVEAQNVIEMYVGQTLTKQELLDRNVVVTTNTESGEEAASFPDAWYWYVSAADSAIFDYDPEAGTVTAKKVGEGRLQAWPYDLYESEGLTVSGTGTYLSVKVVATQSVSSITLNNSTLSLAAGASQKITATTNPAGATVTWETGNSAVATVDAEGNVTGVANGTAVIFAKAGSQVATCTVTVSGGAVTVTGISLNKTAMSLAAGSSETLFATTTPAGGAVSWNTSNAAVATVDNAGKVTAMTAGTATITATSGSYSATCVVTVPETPEVLEPNQWYTDDMGNIYYSNEHAQLTVGWKKIGGYWYLFDYSTAVMKKGWAKDAGTWYYLQSDGKMKTGWLKDGSTWYYLQASGAMKTGWLKDGGVWYYLKDSGAMATGWVKVSGIWYYLQGSGAMKEGWLLESGVWYYLTPSSGAMLANGTYTVEGRKSQFAASGRWLGYV